MDARRRGSPGRRHPSAIQTMAETPTRVGSRLSAGDGGVWEALLSQEPRTLVVKMPLCLLTHTHTHAHTPLSLKDGKHQVQLRSRRGLAACLSDDVSAEASD